MPIYYLDLENGNDANDGLSFANRWRTFASGATAARIAPGDTIRVMGSPLPTSLGQVAQWTSAKTPASIVSFTTTNTTPIVVTRNAHGFSNGNTVVISGHAVNTNANGTWTIANVTTNTFELVGSVGNGVGGLTGTIWNKTNAVVTLTSAVTQSIASTANVRSAWTASANVTATINASTKCGDFSDALIIAAGFTTGLAAYFPTGTLDLSGYQQVSFWIRQTAGNTGGASVMSLRLCSDATGNTPVNTITIPTLGSLGQWQCVTVNTGAALGSSIQSIAFYVDFDNGAQTFLLSNVIACKAASEPDSLTLNSLIGKNDGQWWGIQSIDGTRVMLDVTTNTLPSAATGYYGTTESVTTWKCEPMGIGTPAAATNTQVHSPQDSGTAGSPIIFSGGWNRTDMSTQDGETWLDGRNGLGQGITLSSRAYITLEKFGTVRYGGFGIGTANANSTNFIINNCQSSNCASVGFSLSAPDCQLNNCIALCNVTGISITGARTVATGLTVLSNSGNAVTLNATDVRIDTAAIHNTGGTAGIAFVAATLGNKLKDVSIFDGLVAGLVIPTGTEVFGTGLDIRRNAQAISGGSFGEAVVLSGSSTGNGSLVSLVIGAYVTLDNWISTSDSAVVANIAGTNNQTYFDRFGNTNDDHRIYGEQFLIQTDASVRNTAADFSWKCNFTAITRNQSYPIVISLGRYRVLANVQATATLRVRRDHVNANVALLCRGGQLPGVGSVGNDISDAITAAIDTWQTVTITFTPTQSGVIELSAMFWTTSANRNAWIDDLVFSQPGLSTITNGLNVVSNGRIINPGNSVSSNFRQVNINGGADQ